MNDLRKLMDDAEMLADVNAYDAAKAPLEREEDELVPLEIAERRLAGESTVKIWREHRGLTQEKLAQSSKVSRPMIAAIEAGHMGGIATLKKLARALRSIWIIWRDPTDGDRSICMNKAPKRFLARATNSWALGSPRGNS